MSRAFRCSIQECINSIRIENHSNPDRSFLIFGDELAASTIAEGVAVFKENHSLTSIDITGFGDRDSLMRAIEIILRSKEKGMLLFTGLDNLTKDSMLILGKVCGDRELIGEDGFLTPAPGDWSFIASCQIGDNKFLNDPWFYDRFARFQVVE